MTMISPNQREIQAEYRRKQLLNIALTLFAERGIENVSMKDLAVEAQVAPGLIYHYFQSKDALLAAVFEEYNPFPHIQAIIRQMYGLPVEEGLMLFTNHLVRLMPQKRNIFRILLHELISPRTHLLELARPSQADAVGMLVGYFQERIVAGELKSISPAIPIQMLISSFLISLVAEQPLEKLAPQLVKVVLDGIRVQG